MSQPQPLLPEPTSGRSGRALLLLVLAAVVALGVGNSVRDAPQEEPEEPPSAGPDAVTDLVRGALRWQHEIEGGAGMVADSDAVYIHDGKALVAVAHSDGGVRWRVETPGGALLEPLRAGVPLLGSDGVLRLVGPDGVRWEHPTTTSTARAITAGSFVVVADGDRVTSLLPNGRELWRIELAGVRGLHRAAGDSGLLLAPTATALHALHPLSGAEAWTASVDVAYVAPVGAGATVVVAGDDQVLVGLDRRSGEELWRAPFQGLLDVSAVGDGHIAVVTTRNGEIRLRFFQADTGTELGAARLDPAVVNVVPTQSYLVAISPDRLTAYDTAANIRWEMETVTTEVRELKRSGDHLLLVSATELTAVTAPR